MIRVVRALNLPGLAAVAAFVWAVCAIAGALEPFALTGVA